MNNPFDYTPDARCDQAFRELTDSLERLKSSADPDDIRFIRELESGKMLGVLIAADPPGAPHTLYAFSGQLGTGGFIRSGFAGAVFDYLRPDGYFKTCEAAIVSQNAEIETFETGPYSETKDRYDRAKDVADAEIAEFKEQCRRSKDARDAKREAGVVDEAESEEMIRQSQFEKAELRRLKKRLGATLEPLAAELREVRSRLQAMKEKRRRDSEALQNWLFENFRVLNARGESRSLKDIFAETPMRIPPSGAGECCAPKLLQAAYLQGWRPLAIAEYWYGRPKSGELRIHRRHYPACRGKCLPVLKWMLQGLDIQPPLESENQGKILSEPKIIFENEWFCVVEKPSGMLSVPGRGATASVQQWLAKRYGPDRRVTMAHRLDQDTSGLLIAAFGTEPLKILQALFAKREVEKTYVAELDGDYAAMGLPRQGSIGLPLIPDWLDRPRQRVDFESGKEAVTEYEFIGVTDRRSRVIFLPRTGRTHQLRVHAASDQGLGMPISGDRLYGKNAGPADRLRLHAHIMEFTFPIDGHRYRFESPVPF